MWASRPRHGEASPSPWDALTQSGLGLGVLHLEAGRSLHFEAFDLRLGLGLGLGFGARSAFEAFDLLLGSLRGRGHGIRLLRHLLTETPKGQLG